LVLPSGGPLIFTALQLSAECQARTAKRPLTGPFNLPSRVRKCRPRFRATRRPVHHRPQPHDFPERRGPAICLVTCNLPRSHQDAVTIHARQGPHRQLEQGPPAPSAERSAAGDASPPLLQTSPLSALTMNGPTPLSPSLDAGTWGEASVGMDGRPRTQTDGVRGGSLSSGGVGEWMA
jgi:hypothetical protein